MSSTVTPRPVPEAFRRSGRGSGTGCVLILDAHPLFGRILFPALRDEGIDVHEVGVASPPTMAAAVARHGTGVVLLELALDRERTGGRVRTGPLVTALNANGNPVLAVSGRGDDDAAACAVAAGAVGVLSKDLPLPDLVDATVRAGAGLPVMRAAEHALWLARHRDRERRRSATAERLGRLRPREREILRLLATGRRAGDIAVLLRASSVRVRAEIRSMLETLGVGSQIEAVAILFESRADAG